MLAVTQNASLAFLSGLGSSTQGPCLDDSPSLNYSMNSVPGSV